MIAIKFEKTSNKFVSFLVSGHAGYDEYNKDIVCSAVCAIAQTTIIGVLEVLHIKASYVAEDGNISLDIKKRTIEDIEKSQILMETMFLGLRNMELSYGDYINVEIEEV